jgi:hypothetical protein
VQEVEVALSGVRDTDVDALLTMHVYDEFGLNLCLCGPMLRLPA